MEMKNGKAIPKTINNGIEILRFILCLWIVIHHCSIIKEKHIKYIRRAFHVPTFVLMSFYFFYPYIRDRKIEKIVSRFQRLLYPYVLWPIIILLLNNFFIQTTQYSLYKTNLSLKDAYIQIIIGVRYHGIFWFQFNLIFISLFLSIISFLFKDYSLIILEYFGFLSLYLLYSKINLNLFIYYDEQIQKAIGSLVEIFPLTIIGCYLNFINILVKAQNISLHSHLFLLIIIYFLFEYNIFIYYPGFMYPNIILNIFASIILFITFGTIKMEKIFLLNSILKHITKYTGGIYYVHQLFNHSFRKYILFFKKQSYFSACVIYIISYLMCFTGYKFFKNYKLKYLFI